MDSREIDRHVEGAAGAHQRLLTHLDDVLAGGDLDPAQPSRLPDWTIGHLLTHIARNADSFVRAMEGAARGEVVDRYPPGARDVEIEEGAGREAAALVDDVRSTIWKLETTWSAFGAWDGASRNGDELEPVAEIPMRRWREVDIHHVDLGIGYAFGDCPADFVRLELRRLEMLWSARRPMGMTNLPDRVLQASPADRLAWFYGRIDIDGVSPPSPFK